MSQGYQFHSVSFSLITPIFVPQLVHSRRWIWVENNGNIMSLLRGSTPHNFL